MLDLRKFSFSIALPAAIVVVALLIQLLSVPLPDSVRPVAEFLPYLFLISAMGLAWVFHHSREFHILVLVSGCYWAMQNITVIESNGTNLDLFLLYGSICLLLPINIVVISLLSERGIINFHGIRRLFFFILQAMFIFWLSQSDVSLLVKLFEYKFIDFKPFIPNTIPQVAQLTLITSFIFLVTVILKNPNVLLAARASTLVCLWYALNVYNESFIAILWFSVIGITLLSAMILNSKQLAYLDELTNLPSRRALKQYLGTLGKHYSIAMVDIDYFKKINDRHGHDIGDQVLKMLASHLRKVQGGGRAFRYGGEEFTIVFANKNTDEAAIHAENLRQRVENTPFVLRHKYRPKQKPDKPRKTPPVNEIKITISIGIAQRSELLLTIDEVFKVADDNLYKAKKKGRNQVVT